MKNLTLIYFLIISFNSVGQSTRPNFLIIMADDCTCRDLEVYGGQAKTPSLNNLAEEGMKFNRCFQTTAMCAATRQNLLTGIYLVRNAPYANQTYSYEHIKSIVHHMEPAGYRMGLTGKRHTDQESVYPIVRINYKNKAGSWAFLGIYSFDESDEQYIELIRSKSDYPLIADAILLVP